MLFSSICLLTHGLVKVVLVAVVLKNKLWAYPWMIAAGFHRVSAVPNRTSGQRGDDRTDNSSTSSLLP
ncbi:hypothetical protein [Corynebacterium deserti]|uniref:hypothetical protein n=1 Tax=Corynebacterium deserti TaxID=1408191 RepID=UPI0006AD3175|nr:hypothetical protein [Corynebacterium deserti]